MLRIHFAVTEAKKKVRRGRTPYDWQITFECFYRLFLYVLILIIILFQVKVSQ
jgi:hypothetical protein